MNRKLVKILGCNVDDINIDNALEYAYAHCGNIITLNPEMIQTANSNEEFKNIINNASLVIPDGIGVKIGLKILGCNVNRIAGIEFGKALVEKFSNNGKSVAFIGAKPGIAQEALDNLKKQIPNINAVYIHDGYFSDDNLICEEIAKKEPDLILVALGSPKQEYFIEKLKIGLPKSCMIGLGGSFDVWAGKVKRAPKIYQNLGLEWLYRTISEPKRIKRIFPTLPLFILSVVKERLTGK